MKKIDKSNVTVIIPTLNEEESIGRLLKELNEIGYDNVLIIDGNSTDRTVEIAKNYGANVIIQYKKGKGSALRQAFNYDIDDDVIVMMDADGSMSPKEIPRYIEALEKGSDFVKGSRFLSYGYSEDMSLIRRFGNQFFLLMINLFWRVRYTDLCYGFAAFRIDAIKKLLPYLKSKNFEIETEIIIKACKMALKVTEVPSIEFRRRYGKSNLFIFSDGFRILKTIIEELAYRNTIKVSHR